MKFLIKSNQVCARVKSASVKLGFTQKVDLYNGGNGDSSAMFSIFDDVAMTVSHYNKVNEAKTAEYRYIVLGQTQAVYALLSLLAKKVSFDLIPRANGRGTLVVGRFTTGEELRELFLSRFTAENEWGRKLTIANWSPAIIDPALTRTIEMSAPDVKDANFALFTLQFDGSSSRTIRTVSTTFYKMVNAEEILGCPIDDLVSALSDENAIEPIQKMLEVRGVVNPIINNKAAFGLDKGHIIGYDPRTGNMEYVLLRGKSENLLIKMNKFLSTVDLTPELFSNVLRKSNGAKLLTTNLSYSKAVIEFEEGETIKLNTVDIAAQLSFKSGKFDILK
jgi:hypothetical protein